MRTMIAMPLVVLLSGCLVSTDGLVSAAQVALGIQPTPVPMLSPMPRPTPVPFVMPRTAEQADFIGYQVIAAEDPCLSLAQSYDQGRSIVIDHGKVSMAAHEDSSIAVSDSCNPQ